MRDRLRVPLGAEAPRLRYPAAQGDFLVGLQQGNPPDVPTIPPPDGLVRLPGLGADAPTGGARGVPPSASAILACSTCVVAAVFCQCPGLGRAHARALAA